ncbi:hypothetical protein QPK92_20340 [Escherichia coli]|nr:hypothetical protein [Escherichia coli]MDS1837446.1 hypothetical protein [Escherichia coli]
MCSLLLRIVSAGWGD